MKSSSERIGVGNEETDIGVGVFSTITVSFVVEHIGTSLRHAEQLVPGDIFNVALGDSENQIDSA